MRIGADGTVHILSDVLRDSAGRQYVNLETGGVVAMLFGSTPSSVAPVGWTETGTTDRLLVFRNEAGGGGGANGGSGTSPASWSTDASAGGGTHTHAFTYKTTAVQSGAGSTVVSAIETANPGTTVTTQGGGSNHVHGLTLPKLRYVLECTFD